MHMAVKKQANNLNLGNLMWRMLLAYGLTAFILLCFVAFLFMGLNGLILIVPFVLPFVVFIMPISLLTFGIKLFTNRLSTKHSFYIALISIVIFLAIASEGMRVNLTIMSIVLGSVIAYGTGVLLAVHLIKPTKQLGLILVIGLVIGIVIFNVGRFALDPNRLAIEKATSLAANLPEHRDEVIEPYILVTIPDYPEGTKITLEKDTWQPVPKSGWNPYRGSAYAIVDPPGKKVLIKFGIYLDDKWYIEEVTDNLDRSDTSD
jgi:hypothetical protein